MRPGCPGLLVIVDIRVLLRGLVQQVDGLQQVLEILQLGALCRRVQASGFCRAQEGDQLGVGRQVEVGVHQLVVLYSSIGEVEPHGQELPVELDPDIARGVGRMHQLLGVGDRVGVSLFGEHGAQMVDDVEVAVELVRSEEFELAELVVPVAGRSDNFRVADDDHTVSSSPLPPSSSSARKRTVY